MKTNDILIRLVHLLISVRLNTSIDGFLLYLFTIMIHELFDQTLKRYSIQAKALSNLSGVSQNHISEFRGGKLKTGVTSDCLYRLLVAMDELSPGSRRYFCDLLAGKKNYSEGFDAELEFYIDAADEAELGRAMLQIVNRLFPKENHNNGDKQIGIYTDAEDSRKRIKSSIP